MNSDIHALNDFLVKAWWQTYAGMAREKNCPSYTIAANLEVIFQVTLLTVHQLAQAPFTTELTGLLVVYFCAVKSTGVSPTKATGFLNEPHFFLVEKQCCGVQRELFTRVKAEGWDAECLLAVSITVGAAADQQPELSHSELCDNWSLII